MPRRRYLFDPPQRFVAGTVGEPGDRTFFLQARDGGRVVSIVLEKVQVAVLAERLGQLLEELCHGVVAAGMGHPRLGQDTPSPAQVFGHRAQALPERLIRESATQHAHRLGQRLLVDHQSSGQPLAQTVRRDGRGEGLHEARADGLVATQDMVAGDAQGLSRDLRRHVGVAVPIAADP